jgi:hypothetical protein
MADAEDFTVRRVEDEAGRQAVIAVLAATYCDEKRWVSDAETQIPASDVGRDDVDWFVAEADGQPCGVVRVLREPPIAAYARYDLKALDPALRIEDFINLAGIAEVGRFAVVRDRRRQFLVAAALMRAVTIASLQHGVTRLITDVFEDDPNSPFGFHTRVLGFRPVATHDFGELNSASRRITLVLDIASAYKRLRHRNHWFYRYVTGALSEELHERLAA